MKAINSGLFFGCLGGIVAIIGLPLFYEESTAFITTMCYLLIMAAMFFAVAGSFSKNGQWEPKIRALISFIVAGMAVVGLVADMFDVYFSAIEIILAAVVIIIAFANIPTEQ